MGVIVRGTLLDIGVSAAVRVNDRGSYVHDRALDLFRWAAEVPGMRRQGLAVAHVEVL